MNPNKCIAIVLFLITSLLSILVVRFPQASSLYDVDVYDENTDRRSDSYALDNNITPPRSLRSISTRSSAGSGGTEKSMLYNEFHAAAEALLPNVQVNRDPGNLIDDFAPVVAVADNGFIYVVWNVGDALESILFAQSGDGGATFSEAIRINDNVNYPPSYGVYQPDIALDGDGNIYIVWHDYRAWLDDDSWNSPVDVYLDKSTDGGLTWGTDIKVSDGSGAYPWHFQPYIAIDRGNGYAYVSFTDYDRYYPEGDGGDVCVSRSVDGGASFENKVRVDDTPDDSLIVQTFSSIAVDHLSGNVYVTFNDSRNGDVDIFLATSLDSCQSFETNVPVNSNTTNAQEESTVRTDLSGHMYVVWKDWRDDPDPQSSPYLNDIYLARSTDEGTSFSPGVRITDQYMNAEYSYNFPSRMAIDESGTINVVWHDTRTDTSVCYFDQSTDGGMTFSTDMVIHDAAADSVTHSLPRVAVDTGNGVFITWMDKRNGGDKFDIFFTQNDHTTDIGDGPITPSGFSLEQNYPNPFNPTTTIRYSVTEPSYVQIRMYDSSGRFIRVLANENKSPGTYELLWNGKDSRGVAVASGVYFCRMNVGDKILGRKFVLLR